MASLFAELKDRRIVQFVGSYAVSGWVVLEVLGALADREILSETVYQVAFVVYLGGMLIALIAGWYHGEKGHQQTTRVEKVLLAGVVVGTLFVSAQVVQDSRAAVAAEASREAGRLRLERVAVLEFSDRSRDGSLGYLAEGLTEALRERLTDVQGLDIVSRGGSEQYGDAGLPLDSVAVALSAGTLLSGWVEPRRSGLRIQLVLYDGEGGTEVGRESVEAPADSVFVLQDAVAEAATSLLRESLRREVSMRRARRGTDDVQAWTLLQRGNRARREAMRFLEQGDLPGFIREHQRADSLFGAAERVDAAWAEPTVARAGLASVWGELSVGEDPEEGREYFARALGLADVALGKESRHANAYQARGTVRYQMWRLGLTSSERQADQLFEQARSDLEEATRIDPKLAPAFATLSNLYSQIPDPIAANLAARQALDADEFLGSADIILLRLYSTSYDLEQFGDAIRYCDEGRRRFPSVPAFVQCRLWLLSAPRALDPDPDAAWRLMEDHLALLPERERPAARAQDQLLVAMVLARAELADSARSVVGRVEAGPDIDPGRELLGIEALVHLALGDERAALDGVRAYLAASPEHRTGWRWSSHWWWRPLQSDPDFQRLIGR